MHEQTNKFPYPDRFSFLWLAIAFVLTLFSNGNLTIPLLAWFSSIFALRFMRTCKWGWVGYVLLALATAVTLVITWRGMITLPPPADSVVIISSGLMAGVPFAVDRLLSRRLPGLWATLVFPLTATALEFLNMGSGSPMGSWGATGYSQAGSLILLQMLSITGMWGLTFLMMWLAPVVNWAWEQNFEWPKIWRGLALYGGILTLVLVYGGARLAFAPFETGTVRVASLTTVSTDLAELMPLLKSDRAVFGQKTRDIHARYLAQTVQEARAGAKIILWAEVAGICLEEDEPALLARGKEIAQQEGIYLAIPFFTMYQDANRPPENKLIIFDPSGKPAMEHVKYGGNVFEGSKLGDGILKTIETPYGTLSGVICWDTDFIGNVAQAGRNGTDILLSPAHDWPEITPMHGQMTAFRAIENGVTVIRQADWGFSVVTDPYGRTLAAMNHYAADDRTMVAQVPTQGVRTLYSIIGDLFGWLSVVGFVAITIWAVIRWRKGL